MSTEQDQQVPFKEAMQALYRLCREHRSGTMYIITDKGLGTTISISHGKIVDVLYRMVRGVKALPLMREIKTAQYFFKNDPSLRDEPPTDIEPMPPNFEIFRKMGVRVIQRTSYEEMHNKKKILLVEDSALARKSEMQMLNGKGFSIVEARDGFEALGKLGEENPDLVLLDLILPKMDGYAVLNAMKKNESYKSIPVIVLTSRDALFDKLKGKLAGTNEYLTKPIEQDELLKKLQKYLG